MMIVIILSLFTLEVSFYVLSLYTFCNFRRFVFSPCSCLYGHNDIKTCCRDAGCDYIVLKILTGNVQNKKHGEFAGLFRRLFISDVLSCYVSLDVLTVNVLSHYTLCLFRRFVCICFVTLDVL